MEPSSTSLAGKPENTLAEPAIKQSNWLDHYFGASRRGSSVRTEILAGIATFLASMYIIVVNPAILSDAGIPFSAALSATVLISFLSSLAMGLYARNPILVAPGMGMNALFTYTLVQVNRAFIPMPGATRIGLRA